MQDIIVEKPYKFIPPHRGNWIPNLIQSTRLVDRYLNFFEGVQSHEVRGVEHLKESLVAGHGIVLAPNHCRYADPLAIGWIARQARVHVYAMASWHLFQNRLQAFAMQMCGGFSVYREGLDRTSIDTAVQIVSTAERPLVIFPEGTVFRTNDRLNPLLDGVAFLARTAAKRKAKADNGKVVIHPVAIKYLFRGNLEQTVEPVLQALEKRLTWDEPANSLDLIERIGRLGEGLLSLKEVQYFGEAQKGELGQRKDGLIDRLLTPLEEELFGKKQNDLLMPRIKQLRTKLVPELTKSGISPEEKANIWKQLSDIYVAQIVESYPVGYLDEPTDTRVLETVERFDEDVNDHARIHRPLHAILEVGKPIVCEPTRPPKDAPDPIMESLESNLRGMLSNLSSEARSL